MKIAIGPVFDEFGGVSQYIFGIKKFSCHEIVEVPSKFLRIVLRKSNRGKKFYKNFLYKIGLSRYDAIHSNVNPWFTNLCLSSRTSTCKWIHTYHTIYFDEDYPEGLKLWQKRINETLIEVASKADVRISITKWLHDYLLDTYSIKTEIIPNGIDIRDCDNANPHRFIKKHALSDFILFVGNIQPIKNPKFFVELATQIPEVKFVMIGRDLNRTNLINKYAVSIPKNLVLMSQMSHEDTLDAISACSVFVMTSKREGIPTALLEAMGIGKTVVAPAHSGCQEVIQNDNYGFLYKPDSLDDLINQTRQAIEAKGIGSRARKRVLSNYDWRILTKRIDLLYEA